MPKVAVIVPTYNREIELRRALRSILCQTYQDFSIFVIGDHCTDKTEVMIKLLNSPKIIWKNLERNYGRGGAIPRNIGIKMSQSLYIAYLDDDNYWYPNHLRNLVSLLDKHSDISFVMSYIENRNKTESNVVAYVRDTNVLRRGIVDTSAILHKRELITKYGEWQTIDTIGYFHDWDFVRKWLEGDERYLAYPEATCVFMNIPRKECKDFFTSDKSRRYIDKIAVMNRSDKIYFDRSKSSVNPRIIRSRDLGRK